MLVLSKNIHFAEPTVWHFVWPLAFLVNHDDDHQDKDFCQHTKERPEWSQVTTHPQNRRRFFSPNDVRGATDILARVCSNVKIYNAQFCVIVFVHDEEASSTVVNVLKKMKEMYFRKTFEYAYNPSSLKQGYKVLYNKYIKGYHSLVCLAEDTRPLRAFS